MKSCPMAAIIGHEGKEPDGDVETSRERGWPWPWPIPLDSRQPKDPSRKGATATMEAVLEEILKGAATPIPEPAGPALPRPFRPKPPKPAVKPVRKPVRAPGLVPVPAPVPQYQGHPADRTARGAYKAVEATRAFIPQAWRPTDDQLRGLGYRRKEAVVPSTVRAELSEEVASRAVRQTAGRRKLRGAVAGGIAGIGAAGAYYAGRRARGGGFHFNAAREMRRLTGQYARRTRTLTGGAEG